MKKQKKYNIIGENPIYDDCEVCKAMSKAEKEEREITLEELTLAMVRQNDNNLSNKSVEQ